MVAVSRRARLQEMVASREMGPNPGHDWHLYTLCLISLIKSLSKQVQEKKGIKKR